MRRPRSAHGGTKYVVCMLSTANLSLFYRSEVYSGVGAFFQKLSAKIEDIAHNSVMQDVVRDLGEPVQRPVPHLQNVLLYQHDLVAPILAAGTDIATIAQKKALLAERLDEANRARLLEGVCIVI